MNSTSRIIKVKKNTKGDISDVMLDNGTVCPLGEAIKMTKEGKIEGVNIEYSKNGDEHLKAIPNQIAADNLENLPTF